MIFLAFGTCTVSTPKITSSEGGWGKKGKGGGLGVGGQSEGKGSRAGGGWRECFGVCTAGRNRPLPIA